MWDEILWLRQCVTVSQSSCSCILQTRFKMLLAISQMQVRVGLGWEQMLFGGTVSQAALGAGCSCATASKTPGSASSARSSVSSGTRCPCFIHPDRTPVVGQWGSGFMAISCRGAGGYHWVFCQAGWFPARRGETPSHVTATQAHRALCFKDVP